MIARYRFAGGHRGGRLAASEIKMITAGGFYDRVGDYAALLGEAAAPAMRRSACDFSLSYDYGATINALAKCFALSAAAAAPADLTAKQSENSRVVRLCIGTVRQVLPRRIQIPTRRDLLARACLCRSGSGDDASGDRLPLVSAPARTARRGAA